MRFPWKVQKTKVTLIFILISSVIFSGCISDSSTSIMAPNSSQPNNPLELTSKNFELVLNNSSLFVSDFYYPGCGACKSMNNTTLQLSNELQGEVGFGRMNIRERANNQTVKKYKISAYPTLLFFQKGILVDRIEGDAGKSDILVKLQDLKPSLDTSKVVFQSTPASISGAIVLANKSIQTPEQACVNITKSDKPLLEAFLVSNCPYGLQMQRIMSEIIGKIPQSKNYFKVRYIGSLSNGTIVSMYGDKEAQENLRQICIREEQSEKYWNYVGCYLKDGNSAECLKSAAIDENKLNACKMVTNRGLAYAQTDFNLANKSNIIGSPTLAMNNKTVNEFDFSTKTTNGRSQEAIKELLCCGFNKEPQFCSQQLDGAQAITMFQFKEPTTEAEPQSMGKIIPLIRLGTKNPSQAMLITDATIKSAISNYKPLLVVVGFTDSCGYGRLFNITISELANELQGQVAFGLIDTQRNNDTKAKYDISRVPISLIFKDGKIADTVIGNEEKSNVVAAIKKVKPDLNTKNVKIAPKAPPKPKLTPEQVCANMTKSDQPLLQAFVVSKCPYGLQMQRIMANIINESKETEKYLKVMYIGSVDTENNTITAMHGEAEAQENLRQICVREEQSEKYWEYIKCYIREGNSSNCQKTALLGLEELNSCTNDSSRGLVYAQQDFDLADQFEITGSPTMVMNDEIVKESNFATNTTNMRSPEAVKKLLCCGFNEEPSFCSKELNKSRSATGISAK